MNCPDCESDKTEYNRYTQGYECPVCGWEEVESDNPCLTDYERNQ
jgi:ribosomal protein S27E